ncbi:ABC transporter permease [Corallococcus sp. AB038B]|uniref:ABC transporter permease n=1 Tax=Corallococcus sp. AB038B TaxID=2316718 RepID=UPI000ECFC2D1|nr:ABC transporter permease [Corallococcus sp. AB038B]RKH95815.1 ABC transporter permease [Corallococcus sp. AB038B]
MNHDIASSAPSAPSGVAGFVNVVRCYAMTEWRVLARERTAMVFIFILPAVLSAILGPGVSGLDTAPGAMGRATIGFAVMFSYMVVTYSGHAFYRDFWYHTHGRQALVRPSRLAFAMGKVLPACAMSFVQLLLFTGFAAAFLGLPLNGNVLQVALTGAALVTSGSALGFLLFAITRSTATLSNLSYLVLVTFSAVGGAIVATEALPGWSRTLGYATPHYWALRALNEATFGAGRWSVVLQSTAVILTFTAVCATAASLAFDFRDQKHDTT